MQRFDVVVGRVCGEAQVACDLLLARALRQTRQHLLLPRCDGAMVDEVDIVFKTLALAHTEPCVTACSDVTKSAQVGCSFSVGVTSFRRSSVTSDTGASHNTNAIMAAISMAENARKCPDGMTSSECPERSRPFTIAFHQSPASSILSLDTNDFMAISCSSCATNPTPLGAAVLTAGSVIALIAASPLVRRPPMICRRRACSTTRPSRACAGVMRLVRQHRYEPLFSGGRRRTRTCRIRGCVRSQCTAAGVSPWSSEACCRAS